MVIIRMCSDNIIQMRDSFFFQEGVNFVRLFPMTAINQHRMTVTDNQRCIPLPDINEKNFKLPFRVCLIIIPGRKIPIERIREISELTGFTGTLLCLPCRALKRPCLPAVHADAEQADCRKSQQNTPHFFHHPATLLWNDFPRCTCIFLHHILSCLMLYMQKSFFSALPLSKPS